MSGLYLVWNCFEYFCGKRVGSLLNPPHMLTSRRPFGDSNLNFTVRSSTFWTVPNLPFASFIQRGGPPGESSLLLATSSYQKVRSSALYGSPFDHFSPSRSLKVNSVASALAWNDSQTPGTICFHSGSQRTKFS